MRQHHRTFLCKCPVGQKFGPTFDSKTLTWYELQLSRKQQIPWQLSKWTSRVSLSQSTSSNSAATTKHHFVTFLSNKAVQIWCTSKEKGTWKLSGPSSVFRTSFYSFDKGWQIITTTSLMDDVPSAEPHCTILTKACKYLRLYGKGYKTICKLCPTDVTEVLKTDKPSVKREYHRKRR